MLVALLLTVGFVMPLLLPAVGFLTSLTPAFCAGFTYQTTVKCVAGMVGGKITVGGVLSPRKRERHAAPTLDSTV
jgi:hypothetical protein